MARPLYAVYVICLVSHVLSFDLSGVGVRSTSITKLVQHASRSKYANTKRNYSVIQDIFEKHSRFGSKETFNPCRSNCLFTKKSFDDDFDQTFPLTDDSRTNILQNPFTLSAIACFYWYLLVFGAAAATNGLPVPSFIPMVPGWPPSDAELVPVIEDSIHFFYISDALNAFSGADSSGSAVSEQLPQLRLAFFNFAEAWVFSFLPLLLADKKRLPLPVVLGTWSMALLLTNAFLAPYLAFRQFFANDIKDDYDEINEDKSIHSKVLNVLMGGTSSLVVGYAAIQTMLTTASAPTEWLDFFDLVKNDRTYLAFAIDLTLFNCFQSMLLNELKLQRGEENQVDDKSDIPFIGLLAWLFK